MSRVGPTVCKMKREGLIIGKMSRMPNTVKDDKRRADHRKMSRMPNNA
jgi:hypothetical protein